jgi:hypothetical protein
VSASILSPVFAAAYEISPIFLTGGIAATIGSAAGSAFGGSIGAGVSSVIGGALPLIAFTEGVDFLAAALAGGLPSSPFARFTVIPSGKLISQQIAHYPFANQAVAANAVITEPLTVSVRMDCPAAEPGAYVSKLAVMTALQAALSAHNASGGLYTVLTPSFPYVNLIMTAFTDISGSGSNQVQYQWQFDFEQPLVTLAAAQQAYSSLLNKFSGGTQITGMPSWTAPGNVGPAVPVS